MIFLVGGIVSAAEIVCGGVFLKIGYHYGRKLLNEIGEEQPKPPKHKIKGGRRRAIEYSTGNELSVFNVK